MRGNVFLRSFPAVAAVLLAAGVAAAQPSDEATEKAKAHFEAARRLYKQASYREAIAEFQKAYNLVPNAASSGLLLYNIANCHEKLAEVPQALRAYKDYLRAVPNADDKNEVLVTISNLEKRLREKGVQQVRVYSTPGGAQVAINGDLKGNTPFSIEIAPGKYFLTLTKKGFRPVEKDFVITADSSLELDFSLNEVKLGDVSPPPAPPPPVKVEEKPAPQPPPAAAKEVKPEGGRVWTWVVGGVGVAAVGGGVAFGLLAKGAEDDLHSKSHDSATAQDLADTAQQDALIANIMLGVGGGMIATSIVLFFVEGKLNQTAEREQSIPSLGLNVDPRSGTWFLSYGGAF
ncbi:MAG: PEGA domain-containing protein [Deltaproteobacteria bacterium]|nr:PEGA domain-containing protein [Deltaproteobacteria bacterium]